ncbi:MAG: methylenetetrahydrofolate reductase [Acidimicrobiales bacterium]
MIPTPTIEERIVHELPTTRALTVTASSSRGLDATIELTEHLVRHGFHVVPHLSARLIVDETHLKEIVDRLVVIGVDDVFVPAGDANPPVGKFDSSLGVLAELEALGRPFARVGITGYPESHPRILDDVTIQAMWDKRQYANYIVSNLCFDAAVYRNWVRRVRERGVDLPILMGLAGPVDRAKLLSVAAQVGTASATRMLRQHGAWFVRLFTPGAYEPSRLLGRLAPTLSNPSSRVTGLHVFTFNQIDKAEAWRRSLAPDHSA